ncbi:virulence factor TspB C-terminal domain-related protein [Acinetobacter colistiniresistens]|uniref:virulence factor TspB C-terminal domain-related protein n=1 Tax=Acinetobacter colistiniresistens TaxID=280145 RepID=UPI000DD0788D|nr:virulence factor TspB C-terminal domain-related protein [Acinetobacter colistiniresistens]
MRFFKYLLMVFLSIISTSIFAQWQAQSGSATVTASSPDAACRALFDAVYPNGTSWKYNGVNSNNTICQMLGSNGGAVLGYLTQKTACPTSGTEDVQSVPFRLRSSQVCISGCLWNPTSEGKMVCGDNTGICATGFKSAGTTCSQNTDLTPTQADKDATKPLDPENPDPKPDPNPDPNDPNGGSGQGRCNGTNNCNTTNNTNSNNTTNNITNEIDINRIIDAINTSTSDLKSAISSLSSSLSSGFKSITDAVGITNSKLDLIKSEQTKTNEKLDTSNKHLKQIEDNGKAASDALGNIDKKLGKSNEHLEKIEEGTTAASDALGDIKKFITDTEGSEIAEVGAPIEGISVGNLDYSIFKVNAQCPASPTLVISLSRTTKSFGIDYSQLCDILQYMGYLISLVAMLHAGQILVRDS